MARASAQPQPAQYSAPQSPKFRIAIPLAVAIALFMENLDSTVIATSVPVIAKSLGVTSVNLSMAVSVYLLSLAVFIPVSGWMADRFGARSVFASAIAIFTLSSALCGASDSLETLVAARALQGIGGAMMMPVGRLILGRSFAKRDLVTAMSYVTIPALIGPMIGPLVGGAISTYTSWRWIFYVNVPIGLIGIAFTLKVIDNFTMAEMRRLDFPGFALVGIGLAGLVLGIENVGRGVLPQGTETALLAVSAAALFLYWRHARRVAAPALDLTLFRIATFRASVLGGALCRIGFGATPFLLPLLFQLAFGKTAIESGAITFTGAIGALLMKVAAKTVVQRFGFRRLLLGNAVIVGAATMGLGLFRDTTPIAVMIAVLTLSGFLRTLQFTCMSALTYADLTPAQLSGGTSIASVAQQISMSLGVAMGATLLHIVNGLSAGTSGSPSPIAFTVTFAVVGLLPMASILVFARLSPEAGAEMAGRDAPSAALAQPAPAAVAAPLEAAHEHV